MKNRKLIVLLMTLAVFFSTASLQAAALKNEKKDRQGFFLGFGVGGGLLHYRSNRTYNRAAFLGDIKIGGGVNEKVLLMYEGSFSYTEINSVNLTISNSLFAAQFFLDDNFYLRPGVGFNVATASTSSGNVTVSTNSDVSVAFEAAAGREFRFGKRFALSPELLYTYSHIRTSGPNDTAHALGAKASLLWYF